MRGLKETKMFHWNHKNISGFSFAETTSILINVLTKVEKSYRNTNSASSVEKITDSFKSITPVGIRCNGDAKDIAWKNYTEGTWVDIKGFIYGKKIRKQGEQIRVERIIAKTVTIVGNVQPHKIIL